MYKLIAISIIFTVSILSLAKFAFTDQPVTTEKYLDVYLMKNLIKTELTNIGWGSPGKRENYVNKHIASFLRLANYSKWTTKDLLSANLKLLKSPAPKARWSEVMREWADKTYMTYVYSPDSDSIIANLNPFRKKISYDSDAVLDGLQKLPKTDNDTDTRRRVLLMADKPPTWQDECSPDYAYCGHGGEVYDEETCEASPDCSLHTDRDKFEEMLKKFKEFTGKMMYAICRYLGGRSCSGSNDTDNAVIGTRA
jgi:hypothetical protein